MTKKEIKVLSYGLLGIVVILIVLRWLNAIDTAQAIQILITFTLVVVTLAYVKRTAEIGKATREQAEASLKMAEETKEQRLTKAQPYLLLRLTNEWVKWPPENKELAVTIRNEGVGPAINIEASLWHPKTAHSYDSKGYLASSEEWQVNLSTLDAGVPYKGEKEVRPWLPELKDIIKEHSAGAVVVQYHDIHKRNWLSYLCLEWHGDVPYVRDGEQNIVEWNKND